jgi:hypothetical protein
LFNFDYYPPEDLYAGFGSTRTRILTGGLDAYGVPAAYTLSPSEIENKGPVSFPGYFSTSASKAVANRFKGREGSLVRVDAKPPVIDVIKAAADLGVNLPRSLHQELEYILPKNSQFAVENLEFGDNGDTKADLKQLKIGGLIQKFAKAGRVEDEVKKAKRAKKIAESLLGKTYPQENLRDTVLESRILDELVAEADLDDILSEFEGEPIGPKTAAANKQFSEVFRSNLVVQEYGLGDFGPNATPEMKREALAMGDAMRVDRDISVKRASRGKTDEEREVNIAAGDLAYLVPTKAKVLLKKSQSEAIDKKRARKTKAEQQGAFNPEQLEVLKSKTPEQRQNIQDRAKEYMGMLQFAASQVGGDPDELRLAQQQLLQEFIQREMNPVGNEAERLQGLQSLVDDANVAQLDGDPDLAKRTDTLVAKWNSAAKKGDWTKLELEQSAIDAVLEDINDPNILAALSGGKLGRAAGKFQDNFAKALAGEPLKNAQSARDLQQIIKAIASANYASGGLVQTFSSGGGTVAAMVSNGEAFVPPDTAKKIGYAKLEKMNQADRNGMTNFAGGGISVFNGPGHGTSDSIGPVGLPVGSFVIREKATKALGLNKGGAVGVIQRFADGSDGGVAPKGLSIVSAVINKMAEDAGASVGQMAREVTKSFDTVKGSGDLLAEDAESFINEFAKAVEEITGREFKVGGQSTTNLNPEQQVAAATKLRGYVGTVGRDSDRAAQQEREKETGRQQEVSKARDFKVSEGSAGQIQKIIDEQRERITKAFSDTGMSAEFIAGKVTEFNQALGNLGKVTKDTNISELIQEIHTFRDATEGVNLSSVQQAVGKVIGLAESVTKLDISAGETKRKEDDRGFTGVDFTGMQQITDYFDQIEGSFDVAAALAIPATLAKIDADISAAQQALAKTKKDIFSSSTGTAVERKAVADASPEVQAAKERLEELKSSRTSTAVRAGADAGIETDVTFALIEYADRVNAISEEIEAAAREAAKANKMEEAALAEQKKLKTEAIRAAMSRIPEGTYQERFAEAKQQVESGDPSSSAFHDLLEMQPAMDAAAQAVEEARLNSVTAAEQLKQLEEKRTELARGATDGLEAVSVALGNTSAGLSMLADKAAATGLRQQAISAGETRGAIKTGSQRTGESDEEYAQRKQQNVFDETRRSAKELGLVKTRVLSPREAEAEQEKAQKTKEDSQKELEQTSSNLVAKSQDLLVQAINENTKAVSGSAESTVALEAEMAALAAARSEVQARNEEAGDTDAGGDFDINDAFQDETYTITALGVIDDFGAMIQDKANSIAAAFTDLEGNTSAFGSFVQGLGGKIASGADAARAGLASVNEQFINSKIGGVFKGLSSLGGLFGGLIGTAGLTMAGEAAGGYDSAVGGSLLVGADIASYATTFATAGAALGPFGTAVGAAAGTIYGLVDGISKWQDALEESRLAALEDAATRASEQSTMDFGVFFDSVEPDFEDFSSGIQNLNEVLNTEAEIARSRMTEASTSTYMGFGKKDLEGPELTNWAKEMAGINAQAGAISKDVIRRFMSAGKSVEEVAGILGPQQFEGFKQQIAEADATYQRQVAEAARVAKSDAEFADAVQQAKDAAFERSVSDLKVKEANEDFAKNVTEVRKRLESTGVGILEKIIGNTPEENEKYAKSLSMATQLMEGNVNATKPEEEKAFNEAYNQAGGGIEGQRAGEAAAAQVRKDATSAGNELLSLGDQTDPEIRKQKRQLLKSQLEGQGIDTSQGLAAQVLASLEKEDPTLEAQKNTAANTELLTKQMAELLGKDLGLKGDTGPTTLEGYRQSVGEMNTGFQGFYEQNQTGVLATGGIAAAAGAAAMVPGVRRGARGAYRAARERVGQAFTPDADMPKPKTRTGGDADGTPSSKRGGSSGAPKPKTSAPSAPKAPRAPRAPRGPKPKVGGGRGRAGLIGLGFAAVTAGAGYFMGGGSAGADEGGDTAGEGSMESPQVVSLLAAIEKNTRCACSGEGRGTTSAGGGAFSIPPETLGMRLSPDQAIEETLTDTSLTAQQRNIDVGMNISDSLTEQGIDTTIGDTGAAIASVMSAPEAVTQEQLGDTRAAIVADQLTSQGIDINTDTAQAALNAIATSTDPAITSFANIAAVTDELARKLGSVGDAATTSADSTAESGKEVRSSTLDWVQGGLTAVGMFGDFIPVVGNIVAAASDLTNSAISGGRAAMTSDPDMKKDFIIDAGINAAAAIPYAGLAAGALKGTKLAAKAGEATAKLGTTGAKVAVGAGKIGVNSAGMALGSEATIAAVDALPQEQKQLVDEMVSADEGYQKQAEELRKTAKTEEEYRKSLEEAKAATIQRINESGGFDALGGEVVSESGGDAIGAGIGAIGGVIGSVVDSLGATLASVLGAIPGVLDYTLRTAIPAIGSALLSAGIATVKLIWDGIKALPGIMYNIAATSLGALWSTLGVLGSVAVDLGKAAIGGIWTSLKALPGWLLETAMFALSGIWSGLTSLPGFLYETGMSALGMIWTGVVEIPGLIIGAIGNIGSMIGSAFQAVGGMIGEGLYAAGSFLVQTASDAFTWLSENWYKIPGLLWDAIKGWGAYLGEVFVGISKWVGGQMYRVMANIFNGMNDLAFKVLSQLPGGESVAKGLLGLADPDSKKEQDRRALQAQSWQEAATPKPQTQTQEAAAETTPLLPATQASAADNGGTGFVGHGRFAVDTSSLRRALGRDAGTMGTPAPMQAAGSMSLQQAQGVVANQQNIDTSNLYRGGPVGAGDIGAALNQYDQIQALDEAKRVVAANEAANVAMDMVPQPPGETGRENLIPVSQQTSGGGVSTGGVGSDMQAAAPQIGTTIATTFVNGTTDALQATFGGFIERLGAIQFPKVPDTINMQGTHTVEVVINGAEAFKNMQESIQTMISEQINEKVKWINNQTEGGLGP